LPELLAGEAAVLDGDLEAMTVIVEAKASPQG